MESKNKKADELKELNRIQAIAEKNGDLKLVKSIKARKKNINICKNGKDEN